MRKLKFALIGTGGIAQTYAQAFQTSDCCRLVAVADVNENSAKAFAEPFGAKFFADYKTLAETSEIDAVIVSTPPNTHPEITMYFMRRGANVLCEKPLCLSVAEAKQMIECAEKSNVVFTMATKFRYVEDVIKAKAMMPPACWATSCSLKMRSRRGLICRSAGIRIKKSRAAAF